MWIIKWNYTLCDIYTKYNQQPSSKYHSIFLEASHKTQKYEMKVIEVMEELIETSNMRHFTSYSENGVSWKKNTTDLESLQDITPIAG